MDEASAVEGMVLWGLRVGNDLGSIILFSSDMLLYFPVRWAMGLIVHKFLMSLNLCVLL